MTGVMKQTDLDALQGIALRALYLIRLEVTPDPLQV